MQLALTLRVVPRPPDLQESEDVALCQNSSIVPDAEPPSPHRASGTGNSGQPPKNVWQRYMREKASQAPRRARKLVVQEELAEKKYLPRHGSADITSDGSEGKQDNAKVHRWLAGIQRRKKGVRAHACELQLSMPWPKS